MCIGVENGRNVWVSCNQLLFSLFCLLAAYIPIEGSHACTLTPAPASFPFLLLALMHPFCEIGGASAIKQKSKVYFTDVILVVSAIKTRQDKTR
jgi:hypothetical protein